MKDDDVLALGFDAVEDSLQMVKRVIVAHRHWDAAGPFPSPWSESSSCAATLNWSIST